MVVKVENITFRTIVVYDVKNQHKLTDKDKNLLFDIYEHTRFIIKISDKDLTYLTEELLFEWCWNNLSSNCVIALSIETKGNIIGHFEKEEDAVAFKLRWL